MALVYKRATLADLDILTETRIEVLRAANRLDASADMTQVERATLAYYRSALADGSHTAYLVFDGDVFVGAGGVSYYAVMLKDADYEAIEQILEKYVNDGYSCRGTIDEVIADMKEMYEE